MRNTSRGLALLLPAVAAVIILSSCSADKGMSQRDKRAARGKGDIVIGVVHSSDDPQSTFSVAIKMAEDEINRRGGILGRKLRLIHENDNASVTRGRIIAEKFVRNPDVVAVIGHLNSYVSLPTSRMYQRAGILMVTPTSSAPEITSQGYDLVFQVIASDAVFGELLAAHAAEKGYRKVIIYYENNDYGKGLANNFEAAASARGLLIADRLPYMGQGILEHKVALTRWQVFEYDAIMLAGTLPSAAYFIKYARESGLECPIIGGEALSEDVLFDIAGLHTEGLVAATDFIPDDPRPKVKQFVSDFYARSESKPDNAAACSYDALMLVADAMERAESAAPDKVAEALHSTAGWEGVTGVLTFNDKGEVENKKVGLLTVQNGEVKSLKDFSADEPEKTGVESQE